MENVTIRRARENEFPLAIKLNKDVFTAEQGIPEELLVDFLAYKPAIWFAELNGEICATVAAWVEDGKMHCGRFVVLPNCRGLGVGGKLVKQMFTELFESGAERLYMEVRPITYKIVSKLGGKVAGESFEFYGDAAIPMEVAREDFFGV